MARVFDFDDVSLHAETWGDSRDSLVVALHGFPDTPHTFRHLGPHLANRGYYVVAPYMRGYAPSSLSRSGSYQIVALAADALAIRDAIGDDRSVLIGHDWGAAATYPALALSPARFRRAVTMAVPPPPLMARAFTNFHQLRRSWYMFFLLHRLSDVVVPLDNYEFIRELWREWSPGYAGDDDAQRAIEALSSPENLGAALEYYRSMLGSGSPKNPAYDHLAAVSQSRPLTPQLYLHGRQDGCISSRVLIDPLAHLGPGSRIEIIDDVGHFLHLEKPEVVHALIDDFLDE
jgi:pimeloyl-ACP methyl ester carboxylesterase